LVGKLPDEHWRLLAELSGAGRLGGSEGFEDLVDKPSDERCRLLVDAGHRSRPSELEDGIVRRARVFPDTLDRRLVAARLTGKHAEKGWMLKEDEAFEGKLSHEGAERRLLLYWGMLEATWLAREMEEGAPPRALELKRQKRKRGKFEADGPKGSAPGDPSTKKYLCWAMGLQTPRPLNKLLKTLGDKAPRHACVGRHATCAYACCPLFRMEPNGKYHPCAGGEWDSSRRSACCEVGADEDGWCPCDKPCADAVELGWREDEGRGYLAWCEAGLGRGRSAGSVAIQIAELRSGEDQAILYDGRKVF
jgi:hypothetical protein